MTKRHFTQLTLSLLLLVTSGWTATLVEKSALPLPPTEAVESITEADLLQHAEFLASDELGGRHALSPSIRIAARYLASRLRHFGYRGGGDNGSFFQKVELVTESYIPTEAVLETIEPGPAKRFAFGQDFNLSPPFAPAEVSGPLVLVPAGFGEAASVESPIDLRGKIAVVPASFRSRSNPSAEAPRQSGSGGRRTLVRRITTMATQKGAIAVVMILDGETASPRFPESLRTSAASGGPLRFAADVREQKQLPMIQAYSPLVQWMLDGTGMTVDSIFSSETVAAPRDLEKQMRITIKSGRRYETENVIGILEGSEPKLKHEYVMLSAHYDHLRASGEKVFNGADDDGSGTSTVLEIAQAFAVGPRPRRSILIIFHTAEEENLLGSTYFVQHPTVPLKSIVVDLNVDMVGRTRAPGDTNPANAELSDANTVYLIGSDALSSELHRLSEQTNEDTVRMTFDYRYSRSDHPYKLYYRSDHWNYAKNNIPVIFYFTGLHEDYHQPTDDVEKLDFKKMVRIGRLIFATGWRIAHLDQRLKLDHEAPKP
jgi:hypothetical protein